MAIEVKVPVLPESITDATVSKWYKKVGEFVKMGENLVDLETDKVMLEVPAPDDGVVEEILKSEGTTVKANELLATLKKGTAETKLKEEERAKVKEEKPQPKQEEKIKEKEPTMATVLEELSPSVRRLVAEREINISKIRGTGKEGRITKEDILNYIESSTKKIPVEKEIPAVITTEQRAEKRVPMSRLRARIAERLVEAQHTAAMLTTFNEVNMKPIMDLRAKYKDQFEKVHGVKLGLMAFFVKASIEALKRFPIVNASIDGTDIIYHGYFDIGIAVSTPRGLVVPVLRDADKMNMAEIEKAIADYAIKARDGKLTLEEMTGGTFTITNGGIFGSMLSTPILNPPQCAILGMHNIVNRAVVENDQIVIRPMMYLALSYDHRIIDGRDSVTFLLTIKQFLEDPARMILGF